MADNTNEALREDVEWLRTVSAHLAQDDADDVAQEAWLAAQRNDAPTGSKRRAWLRVVSRNFARMARRRRATADTHRWRLEASDEQRTAESMVHDRQVLDAVREAMLELSEADQDVLTRRFLHEQDVAEIATALELEPGAVRTRVSRALQRVRARLDRHYGGRDAWVGALLGASLRPSPARRAVPWIAAALVTTAMVGVWLNRRGKADEPEVHTALPVAAAAAEDDRPADRPARPAPTVEASPSPRAPNAARSAPTEDGEKASSTDATSRATAVQTSLKAIGSELAEVSEGCFTELPADATGTVMFNAHVRSAPDIGAVLDDFSRTSEASGLTELEECLEGSIPAFHLDAVNTDLDQRLSLKVDLDRNMLFVHTTIEVDDVDAYVEQQREMGTPEAYVRRLAEQLRETPIARTGVGVPLEGAVEPGEVQP